MYRISETPPAPRPAAHRWYNRDRMAVVIEFKPHGARQWDFLGRFSASEEELLALRELLQSHDDLWAVLDRIPKGLLWDTLDVLRSEGYEARVSFVEDN